MKLKIQSTFTNELPPDSDLENNSRQVYNACFSFVTPKIPLNPTLIHFSNEVAKMIGIEEDNFDTKEFLNIFSGKTIYPNTQPYAMCYAGHQFGNWAGQLGDGRAINLFEIEHKNTRLTLQLKGAGQTPYSRNADGLAVLRSSIREYLCAEAMHNLGVPTTRSLSLSLSGNTVLRDMLYNGNPEYEKGAIVCRAAPSFIRFGNFEIFAARNDIENLKLLTDYTIKHHFSEISTTGKHKYLDFFEKVVELNLKMVVQWQHVGFVHGVMNTDNMSIHGITIDYGPYGWMDDYNPNWTPNTTDNQHKRYRFGNQPHIVLWNLYQLANAMYPLIESTEELEIILNNFENQYQEEYTKMMLGKIGLPLENEESLNLIAQLEENLQLSETDMTIFFRNLSTVIKNDTPEIALQKVAVSFYNIEEIQNTNKEIWLFWFANYILRLQKEIDSDDEKKLKMNAINPKYVLRNYMSQLAIDNANNEDYSIITELYEILQNPYDEQPKNEKWFAKRPDWAKDKVGCSMLSCSS